MKGKMEETSLPIPTVSEKEIRVASDGRKDPKKWILALYVSAIGGIFFGLIGLIVSGLALFGLVERTRQTSLIGALLLIAAFFLLMLGAHAMDKITEIDRNEKLRAFEAEQNRKLYSPEQWKKQ